MPDDKSIVCEILSSQVFSGVLTPEQVKAAYEVGVVPETNDTAFREEIFQAVFRGDITPEEGKALLHVRVLPEEPQGAPGKSRWERLNEDVV
jgi:hypothetical protein